VECALHSFAFAIYLNLYSSLSDASILPPKYIHSVHIDKSHPQDYKDVDIIKMKMTTFPYSSLINNIYLTLLFKLIKNTL
jgi:hypothetical protein